MAATTSEMALVVRAKNQASRVLRTVGRDLDTLNTKTSRTKKALLSLKKVAVVSFLAIGVAAAAVVAKSITAWASFDDKMTQSLAIMGDISKEVRDEMELVARDVAKTTRFSAEQAAEAYFFLASAGLDAEQSMASMPQVAAFAQAGMFDLARATDLATDAQSALGLTVPDAAENLKGMTRVTDVLVKANTLANASVEQFAEALTNKAGVALKLANKDIEEGVAVLAVFADQGVKGQVAGNMFSRALKGLQINALKNKDAFEKYSVSVYDADGNMRNMADITADLTSAFSGLSDTQKTQALLDLGFSARQQDVIKMLIGTEDQMRAYESALRDAGGTTQEVADKQLKSMSAQFDILKSLITDVFIGLGKKLAPAFAAVIAWMQKFVKDSLPKVIAWLEKMWVKLTKVAKVIWDVLILALRRVIRWWEELSPGLRDAIKFGAKFAAVAIAMGAGLSLIIGLFAMLASPVLAIIAGLVALGAAIKLAWDNWQWFRDIVQGFIDWFLEIDWASIWSTIQEGWENVKSWWSEVWGNMQSDMDRGGGDLREGWDLIWIELGKLWDKFRTGWYILWGQFWNDLSQAPGRAWEDITTAWNWFTSSFSAGWELFGDNIKNYWSGLWTGISMIFSGALDTVTGLWNLFAGLFTADFTRVWESIKQIFAGYWRIIVGIANIVWANFKFAWGVLWDTVKLIFGGAWTWIKNKFVEKWNGLKNYASGEWAKLRAIWNNHWNLVKTIFSATWTAIKTIFGRKWAEFKAAVASLWGRFRSWVGGVWSNIGRHIVDSLVSGIGGMASAVRRAATSAAKGFVNAFIRQWNRLDPRVRLPSMSIFGHRFGGQTSPDLLPDLPYLAKGGRILRSGLAMVGDAGPEILDLPKGATVAPLTPSTNFHGEGNEYHIHLHGVDLSEGSRKTLLRVREGLRRLDLETA